MLPKPLILTFLLSTFLISHLWGNKPESRQANEEASLRRFVLKSALIPGLGEFRLENNKRGKLFTLTEVGLWLVLSESFVVATMAETRLRSLAVLHAGVNPAGKSDQYFVDIGNYESIEVFNELQQRLRDPHNIWPERSGYDWSWDTEKNRRRFRKLRVQRDLVRKIARFTIGGIVVNHIISAIDAAYLYRTSSLKSGQLAPSMELSKEGVRLQLIYHF